MRYICLGASSALFMFAAACSDAPTEMPPPMGKIRVLVETSGGDPDANGYWLRVGPSQSVRSLAPQQDALFEFADGSYLLTLEDIAPNCTVNGENPRPVTVAAAGTANVSFAIVCESTGVRVTTRTHGSDVPLGYTFRVGVSEATPIGVNATSVRSRLAPGAYTVALALPSGNCTIASGSPITVQVVNRGLTPVLFDVTCTPPVRLERIALGGGGTILLVRPDGTDLVNRWYGNSPAWSPDGTKLVYSTLAFWPDECSGDLIIADPETGTETVLAAEGNGDDPAWAPTGDLIAFTRCDRIYLTKIDRSPAQPLNFSAPGGFITVVSAANPSWSPDGQQIAFTCVVQKPNEDLCVANRDGSGLVRVTSATTSEREPAWSPDGRSIAFTLSSSVDRLIAGQIGVMAVEAGSVSDRTQPVDRKVTMLAVGFDAAWSRDGKKLVFARPATFIDGVFVGEGLFTIQPDGSNLTRLTTGRHSDPAWRP